MTRHRSAPSLLYAGATPWMKADAVILDAGVAAACARRWQAVRILPITVGTRRRRDVR